MHAKMLRSYEANSADLLNKELLKMLKSESPNAKCEMAKNVSILCWVSEKFKKTDLNPLISFCYI